MNTKPFFGNVSRRSLAVALTLLIGSATAGVWYGATTARHALASNPYTYYVDTEGFPSGYGALVVAPVDRSDWSTYITLNESRINAWQSSPPSNGYFGGKYVTVTFEEPVSLEDYDTIVDQLTANNGSVVKYVAVGENDNEDFVQEEGFSAPPENLLDERTDIGGTGSGMAFQLDGVISTLVKMGSSVTPTVLDNVRDDALVYLLDTTAVPIAATWTTPTIAIVEMDSPWHLLTW